MPSNSPINTEVTGPHRRKKRWPPFGIAGEIFGRIWAVWGALWFIATLLVFMIPFFIFSWFRSDPQKARNFIRLSRGWMGIYLTMIGCPLRIKGREKFKKGISYIVICNHNSLIDVPITSPGIPGGNKTIAKMEMAKIPLFGMLYRTGSVLVDRKSEQSRRESFPKMIEVLEMGLHMCLYPEGTRNKSDQPIKPFHNGAFRLAMQTGHPLIPAVIFNSRKVMPADKTFFLWPHPLSMHFLDPIPILPDDTADTLKERAFSIMEDYYISKGKR